MLIYERIKENIKKWLEKNEEQLIRNLGSRKYRELKKNKTLEEYNRAGIDDVGEIVAGEKFKKSNPEFDTDGAISAIKIANEIGDYKKMTAKKQAEADETLRKNFKEKNQNLSDQQLNLLVKNQIKYINEINSNKDIF